MKIVLLDSKTLDLGDMDWSALQALGNVVFFDNTDRNKYAERLGDADILIVNKFKVDEAVILAAPKLKYICVAATGYNNLFLDDLHKHNIIASNVRGYSSTGVAQHVFAMIFAQMNRLHYYASEVHRGRWSDTKDFCFYDHSIEELAGKTFGIIGFGNIGKGVAKIAHAYGMRVLIHSSYDVPVEYEFVRKGTHDEVFGNADVLSLHCPLSTTTNGIINQDNLAKMKPHAILVNTGRGPLINEKDLAVHLAKTPTFTALLDVLCEEPPVSGHPLIGLDNCLITPHIAWASKQSRQRLINGLVENILAFQEGRAINIVTPVSI